VKEEREGQQLRPQRTRLDITVHGCMRKEIGIETKALSPATSFHADEVQHADLPQERRTGDGPYVSLYRMNGEVRNRQ
jgi:hypothetical protein